MLTGSHRAVNIIAAHAVQQAGMRFVAPDQGLLRRLQVLHGLWCRVSRQPGNDVMCTAGLALRQACCCRRCVTWRAPQECSSSLLQAAAAASVVSDGVRCNEMAEFLLQGSGSGPSRPAAAAAAARSALASRQDTRLVVLFKQRDKRMGAPYAQRHLAHVTAECACLPLC